MMNRNFRQNNGGIPIGQVPVEVRPQGNQYGYYENYHTSPNYYYEQVSVNQPLNRRMQR